jgi:SAM-dependent methyltransferase
MAGINRLYSTSFLSSWYPLLTPVEDYQKEAVIYTELLLRHDPEMKSILEMGCGAGHNAYYLKKRFSMTLTDLSPEMLALSKKLNPECEHLQGDMRNLNLNRVFDAVFIHDAIGYLTTAGDLLQTFQTAYRHCKPGGCLIIVPDYFLETFGPETAHGGTDNNGRGMRYLEWTYVSATPEHTIIKEFVFLLKDESGTVKVEYDRHILGLFSRETWLRLLAEAGFQADIIEAPYQEEGIDALFIIYAKNSDKGCCRCW